MKQADQLNRRPSQRLGPDTATDQDHCGDEQAVSFRCLCNNGDNVNVVLTVKEGQAEYQNPQRVLFGSPDGAPGSCEILDHSENCQPAACATGQVPGAHDASQERDRPATNHSTGLLLCPLFTTF